MSDKKPDIPETGGDDGIDHEHLMDHAYDGIQEYDNPTPGWWKLIFAACCVYAVVYWVYYHHGPGKSDHEEYDAEYAAYLKTVESSKPKVSEANIATAMADKAAVEDGRKVYMVHCFSCHTASGKGLVGPNLTDDYQIHGKTRLDVYETVRVGVPKLGMISWEPVLRPTQLINVAAYVATLRHTNVPEGKAKQGEKVEPFAPAP